jgi:hypothetical protein
MGRMDTRRHVHSGRTKSRGGTGVHPGGRTSRTSAPLSSAHLDPAEQDVANYQSSKVRTGIVSVNGQDVGVMHCRQPQ